MPRTARPVVHLAAALPLVALLCSGCSQGKEDFDSNRPDPKPTLDLVVRTPVLPSPDQPTDGPLVQELPGATGGVPGTPSTAPPEASPGEDSDDGGGGD